MKFDKKDAISKPKLGLLQIAITLACLYAPDYPRPTLQPTIAQFLGPRLALLITDSSIQIKADVTLIRIEEPGYSR